MNNDTTVLDFKRDYCAINARVWGFEDEFYDLSKNVHAEDGKLYFAWDGWIEIDMQTAQEYGAVDVRALRKAVDAVLISVDVLRLTEKNGAGYWEQVSGYDPDRFKEWADENPDAVTGFNPDEEGEPEVYTWFLVDDDSADLLKDAGEIVLYNEDLDLYAWGVDHFGTPYNGCPTNIRIPAGLLKEEK